MDAVMENRVFKQKALTQLYLQALFSRFLLDSEKFISY